MGQQFTNGRTIFREAIASMWPVRSAPDGNRLAIFPLNIASNIIVKLRIEITSCNVNGRTWKLLTKDDHGRIAHRGVVAGESQTSRCIIDSKDRNMISALVATIEKTTGWIETEAARVVSSRPFLPHVS